VVAAVVEMFKVDIGLLQSRSQLAKVVRARHAAISMLISLGYNDAEVGALFGLAHGSAAYARRTMAGYLQEHPKHAAAYRVQLDALTRKFSQI